MYVSVVSYRPGTGRRTTSLHLAAYLARIAPTVLHDGSCKATREEWEQYAAQFPFAVTTKFDIRTWQTCAAQGCTHGVTDTPLFRGSSEFKIYLKSLGLALNADINIAPVNFGEVVCSAKEIRAFPKVPTNEPRLLLTSTPRDKHAVAEVQAALRDSGFHVLDTTIPKTHAFSKARLTGQLLVCNMSDTSSQRAWNAYCQLGAEVMAEAETLIQKRAALSQRLAEPFTANK